MNPTENTPPKITFAHEWLTTLGGSEQILAALLEIWPDAPIHTLVYDPAGPCSSFTLGKNIQTSFIQKLPGAKRNHRRYLPLMPLAVEQFDLSGFDVILSISHAVAHGVLPQADQLHINYICIPIRYAWHLYQDYLTRAGLQNGLRGWITRAILHYLRLWDLAAAQRVDEFVAISNWVARNVWRAYRRPATVIYPPVDVSAFDVQEQKEDYYITVTRLVPYKRVDLILDAFRQMPTKKLVLVGDGPDLERLKSQASQNVEFLGFLPFNDLKLALEKAHALIYTAVEDFGIVPLEAQACGTPVIAYGRGGVLETTIAGQTGLFFQHQEAASLVQAIEQFEAQSHPFDVRILRQNAERFNKERFQHEFNDFVDQSWSRFMKKSV